MNQRLSLLAGGLLAAAAVAAVLVARRPEPPAETWETVTVARQDAVALLHESGTLAPHDPLVVPVPFDGKLQWVVEDSTWVQVGEPLFIISDDDELKKVADERQQLVEAKQDRDLAILNLEQAQETEERKVRKASEDLELEHARHRILTEPAKGGMELVRLDQRLQPLTEATSAVRTRFEEVRDRWQKAQDAYLAQLDAWEQHQDALLRLENRLDELALIEREAVNRPAAAARRQRRVTSQIARQVPESGQTVSEPVTKEPGAKEPGATESGAKDPQVERQEISAERDRLKALTPGIQAQLATAKAAREAAAGPRTAAAEELRQAEAAERELRILIEIEKRRLPATQLEFDLRLAEVAAAEAERRLSEGEITLKAQVISQAAYDDLVAAATQARTTLTTTRERLAIAARPPAPEVVVEAEARLAKAQQAADTAEAVRRRNLEILRQEQAVLEAKIARLEASLAVRARRFPSTIEQEITARERELSLAPEDAVRLTTEITALKADLAKAKATPPNVLRAPIAGLVKVRREGDRQKLAGDDVYQADPMCEIFAPQNMEVAVRVNEVNIPLVRQGMRVQAEIPALGRLPRTGTIKQVAGVGRDKQDFAGKGKNATGVTQYEVRIVLDPGQDNRDGDLRQGMSALVAIELERVPQALVLPRAAVVPFGDGWGVQRVPGAPLVPVSGRPLGDDTFLIVGGLAAGDQVVIRRMVNR
jgi:HlyD family secretion protein